MKMQKLSSNNQEKFKSGLGTDDLIFVGVGCTQLGKYSFHLEYDIISISLIVSVTKSF